MKAHLNHKIFSIIAKVTESTGTDAFVVGGYVRDIFLKRDSKDIDIVVTGDGIDFACKVAKETGNDPHVAVFKNFGTAMLKFEGLEIEFVGARKESYRAESRKPVVETGTLDDDLNRRDFTINAMAISLRANDFGHLIDPFGGAGDIQNRLIKTPLDPVITYSDDPLRMMRAIRFSTQLGFDIEKKSFETIGKLRERIRIVSAERITDELNKIILSPIPSIGFEQLFDSGLLEIIFPEMAALYGVEKIAGKSHKDNFYHTLQVLDNISRHTDNLWLRWAAILHDIAKPLTKRFEKDHGWTFHGHEDKGAQMVPGIFNRLKLPMNDRMKFVQKLVLLHLRPISLTKDSITDSAIRRLLYEAGDDIDDLLMLCHADITSKNEIKAKKFHKNFEIVRQKLIEVEESDKIRNWQPPVSGQDIMETFNLKPGREVGIIKNAIREAILDGHIPNDEKSARQFMVKVASELGIKVEHEKIRKILKS